MARVVVRVHPGAKRSRVVGKLGGEWKIAVAAPPVDGKANRACADFLAALTGRPKSAVTLLRGAAARTKTFEVTGVSDELIESVFSKASA